jgi:hypothetical protein
MKESYVDVLLRVRIEHPDDEDPNDLIEEATVLVGWNSDSGKRTVDLEIKDQAYVGDVDPNSGALLRSDGSSGRNVWMNHDPPLE